VWEFVEQLVASGTTVLLTTQYMEEADRLAHQIVVMSTGTVVARGTAFELKEQLGGSVLEARVVYPSDLERAAALLTNFAGSPARIDVNQQRVSVPALSGTEFLMRAGRLLEGEHIALDDLGIRRPSLDDVFLSLTDEGRGTQNGGNEHFPQAAGVPA
jgi:ABC-2 type transport system ATP-binding protein